MKIPELWRQMEIRSMTHVDRSVIFLNICPLQAESRGFSMSMISLPFTNLTPQIRCSMRTLVKSPQLQLPEEVGWVGRWSHCIHCLGTHCYPHPGQEKWMGMPFRKGKHHPRKPLGCIKQHYHRTPGQLRVCASHCEGLLVPWFSLIQLSTSPL